MKKSNSDICGSNIELINNNSETLSKVIIFQLNMR